MLCHSLIRFRLSRRLPHVETARGYSGSLVPTGVMYIRPPPMMTWARCAGAHVLERGGESMCEIWRHLLVIEGTAVCSYVKVTMCGCYCFLWRRSLDSISFVCIWRGSNSESHIDVHVFDELSGDVAAIALFGAGGKVGVTVPTPAGAVRIAAGRGRVLHPRGRHDADRLSWQNRKKNRRKKFM